VDTGIISSEPFSDDFSGGKLDLEKWTPGWWKATDSKHGLNLGSYKAENLDFSHGMLSIKITQTPDREEGILSSGALIFSKQRFGFGTYEFVMRMTSTSSTPDGRGEVRSGAISSGFIYRHTSETEIDLEFQGGKNAIYISVWHNLKPDVPLDTNSDKWPKHTQSVENKLLSNGFHKYTLIWTSKSVRVIIDGKLAATQTKDVPQIPAKIFIQHRGTNSRSWGGEATPNVTRYFYVKSVIFTPEAVK
jgi:beta-glucanase (GH16 family)